MFGQIWAKKVKNVRFGLKIDTHGILERLIRIGVGFSKFRPQNPFLDKFGSKKHSLFILIRDITAVFGHTASSGFIYFKIFTFFCYILQTVLKVSYLQNHSLITAEECEAIFRYKKIK